MPKSQKKRQKTSNQYFDERVERQFQEQIKGKEGRIYNPNSSVGRSNRAKLRRLLKHDLRKKKNKRVYDWDKSSKYEIK